MDIGDHGGDSGGFSDEPQQRPKALPDDLPKSLDDRRSVEHHYTAETEMYDAWQGQSQFLTAPSLAKPLDLQFNSLSLHTGDYDDVLPTGKIEDSEGRLMEMLAAQAAHRDDGGAIEDEEAVAKDDTLSDARKKEILQKALNMAASNGDVERINRILGGKAKDFVDVNAPDEEGTPPLIYASCFGHDAVVTALLDAGADRDKQDRNQWSALMWAMTNRHKNIAKSLLDHGASPHVKSSSGRTAFDFVAPDSEISGYLHDSGYHIGTVGVTDDFYNAGFSEDRFEEELAAQELRRRMMMESARDLEVDLGAVGLDDEPEVPEMDDDVQDFDWNRCSHDQMFVFQENELGRILDIIITNMTPQRSHAQKPVPANILFLSARYAHYYANRDLLASLLITAMDKINDVVETFQWDMTILAFWMSNATLLLHYLKKDPGLAEATLEFQQQLAELINEIFILIIRDAERRMDKVLDSAILDFEVIAGFEDISFQNEWKIFKRKKQVKEESAEKRFRPPSPKQKAKPSPQRITSLLSSTLFVLDLYDIHSVITSQILAQLFYWLGAELFNRVMSNRRYLARTKAMQIRMNISVLEEWARANNRKPEHYEHGSMQASGETTVEGAQRHLAPLIQLLQWLQTLSSQTEDFEFLVATLQQLTRLAPQQLIHSVKHYRHEVNEKGLPKSAMKYLVNLEKENRLRKERQRAAASSGPTTPAKNNGNGRVPETPPSNGKPVVPNTLKPLPPTEMPEEEDDTPEHLLLDPTQMLPFSLPTSTDMLVSYGAGFGGVDRERERKYIPTVPPEFLSKLDLSGGRKHSTYQEKDWENEDI